MRYLITVRKFELDWRDAKRQVTKARLNAELTSSFPTAMKVTTPVATKNYC